MPKAAQNGFGCEPRPGNCTPPHSKRQTRKRDPTTGEETNTAKMAAMESTGAHGATTREAVPATGAAAASASAAAAPVGGTSEWRDGLRAPPKDTRVKTEVSRRLARLDPASAGAGSSHRKADIVAPPVLPPAPPPPPASRARGAARRAGGSRALWDCPVSARGLRAAASKRQAEAEACPKVMRLIPLPHGPSPLATAALSHRELVRRLRPLLPSCCPR